MYYQKGTKRAAGEVLFGCLEEKEQGLLNSSSNA
jgi:hypothetical protein